MVKLCNKAICLLTGIFFTSAARTLVLPVHIEFMFKFHTLLVLALHHSVLQSLRVPPLYDNKCTETAPHGSLLSNWISLVCLCVFSVLSCPCHYPVSVFFLFTTFCWNGDLKKPKKTCVFIGRVKKNWKILIMLYIGLLSDVGCANPFFKSVHHALYRIVLSLISLALSFSSACVLILYSPITRCISDWNYVATQLLMSSKCDKCITERLCLTHFLWLALTVVFGSGWFSSESFKSSVGFGVCTNTKENTEVINTIN